MKPIDDLLSEMMARNASDLHIKAGSPPVIRVDGELALLDEPALTPEDTKDVAASIMTDKQIRRFSEHNEIDFAYSLPDLGRFRVNVFHQRGSIGIRCARSRRASRASRSCTSRSHQAARRRAARPRPRHRHRRLGQDHHAGGDDRPHQPHRARHIVTIEDPIEVLHQDKKCIINQREIGIDTDSYADGAQVRAPPGPRRHPHRRDARPRDGRGGAHRRGDRQPRDRAPCTPSTRTETINRIIDFFPPYQQKQIRLMLAGTLKGIICQRLIVEPTAGRVPAVEVLVMHRTDPRLHPRPGPDVHHHRRHRRGRLLRHADLRPVAAQPLPGRADHAGRRGAVANNAHDFKLLVQSQGHDVSLMTF